MTMTTREYIDSALKMAVECNANPDVVSPGGVRFAWRPVYGVDHRNGKKRGWMWLEWVCWFSPLGLITEYESYRGSEREHRATHGESSVDTMLRELRQKTDMLRPIWRQRYDALWDEAVEAFGDECAAYKWMWKWDEMLPSRSQWHHGSKPIMAIWTRDGYDQARAMLRVRSAQ